MNERLWRHSIISSPLIRCSKSCRWFFCCGNNKQCHRILLHDLTEQHSRYWKVASELLKNPNRLIVKSILIILDRLSAHLAEQLVKLIATVLAGIEGRVVLVNKKFWFRTRVMKNDAVINGRMWMRSIITVTSGTSNGMLQQVSDEYRLTGKKLYVIA